MSDQLVESAPFAPAAPVLLLVSVCSIDSVNVEPSARLPLIEYSTVATSVVIAE
jgi:hypothetical protein